MRLTLFICLIFSQLLAFSDEIATNDERQLEAYFSYGLFYSPQNGPYIETYLSFSGPSLVYKKKENGLHQACVEVTYIFNKGEEIANYKKFIVLSPEVENPLLVADNFLDQQRLSLPNGQYLLDIIIADTNSSAEPFQASQLISVDFPSNELSFSELQLVESYQKATTTGILTKSGLDIVPYVSNFYPENFNKLSFYAEIYNADQSLGTDEMFLVKYYLRKYENKKVLPSFVGYLRKQSAVATPVLKEFDISQLPTGNYELVVEVRDRQNEFVGEKTLFIQRSNPSIKINPNDLASVDFSSTFVNKYNNRDTLTEYVRSLAPISDDLERSFVKNQMDSVPLDLMKSYFYTFWEKRNELNPEREWMNYQKNLAAVEREYGTSIKRGYETDRGRIYLKHGPPNSIVARYNEPTAYPYEIWHYYKIDVRADARFIFYNPDVITNDFELLHSNVYNEIRDYRWKFRLMRRGQQEGNIDGEGIINEQFGNEAEDFFTNPR